MKMILEVVCTTWAVVKIRPKKKKIKKKGLYGILTYDLSNADEAVYQLS